MPPEARAWLANVAVMDLLFVGEVVRARATADEEVAHIEMAGDSSATGLLFAQAAFLAYFIGDFAVARRRSERAVAIARSSGDAEASARAQLVHILARRRLDRSASGPSRTSGTTRPSPARPGSACGRPTRISSPRT